MEGTLCSCFRPTEQSAINLCRFCRSLLFESSWVVPKGRMVLPAPKQIDWAFVKIFITTSAFCFFSFFGFYYYFVLFYCHFFSPGIEVEGRLLRYFIWYSWVRGSRLRDIFLGSPFASHSNGQPFFFGGGFFFSINFVFSDHLLTESNLVSKQRSIYHLFTGHTPKLFWAIEELEVVCFYVVDFAR